MIDANIANRPLDHDDNEPLSAVQQIGQQYNKRIEKEERIKEHIVAIIQKQPMLHAVVKAAGMYDNIVTQAPKIVSILMRDIEGVEVLKALGLHDYFDEL